MNNGSDSDIMKSSAEGTALSEANYLDTHYEAARECYEACAAHAEFQKGWSILDAASGGGSFIPFISEMLGSEGKITAIDLDAENIATIERRQSANAFSCPVEAHVGGITDLPFDDNSFNAIWCAAVTQYLSDEEVADTLDEFRRVTRPGGVIVIKNFDASGAVYGTDILRSWRFASRLETVPDFSKQVRAPYRFVRMPELFKQHGIEPVSYKTFVSDHSYPVAPEARPFLKSYVAVLGWIASQMDLTENDMAFWSRWINLEADDHILNSPDFYYREAHGVAIGRKPISD